ncbi:hypothetical protein B0H11DRAFT_1898723 [Mycena galericulata]|nr:hypothetical protein B0H11DRAFT_1898723 [Mycena galericulata]
MSHSAQKLSRLPALPSLPTPTYGNLFVRCTAQLSSGPKSILTSTPTLVAFRGELFFSPHTEPSAFLPPLLVALASLLSALALAVSPIPDPNVIVINIQGDLYKDQPLTFPSTPARGTMDALLGSDLQVVAYVKVAFLTLLAYDTLLQIGQESFASAMTHPPRRTRPPRGVVAAACAIGILAYFPLPPQLVLFAPGWRQESGNSLCWMDVSVRAHTGAGPPPVWDSTRGTSQARL